MVFRKVQTVKMLPRLMITMSSDAIGTNNNFSLEMNELSLTISRMETSADETCDMSYQIQNSIDSAAYAADDTDKGATPAVTEEE